MGKFLDLDPSALMLTLPRRTHDQLHYSQSVHWTGASSGVQRQSDSTIDTATSLGTGLCPQTPMERVPNEILSLIFELGYFDAEEPDSCFRTLIGKISRRWRGVSLCTPSLWSTYHLSQGNVDDLIGDLPTMLERSRDYPLSIFLNCFWDSAQTEEILDIFVPHSKRWKLLSITIPGPDIFRYLRGVAVPRLETLRIYHFSSQRHLHIDPRMFGGQLPSLRHLVLRNMTLKDTTLPLKGLHSLDIRGYGIWPSHAELNQLIGGSSTLQKLILHVRAESVLQDMGYQEISPIFLPALRNLEMITSEWLSPHIATLSNMFSCLAMDSFTLMDNSATAAKPAYDIVRYSRSGSASHPDSPTLRVRSCDLYHARNCLSSSRHITTLELDDIHWPHWSNVMTVLAALPLLENMIIPHVDPTATLSDLGEPVYPFKIASLKKLEVGAIKRKRDVIESDLARFISLFEVPKLQLLAVRNISAEQWKHVLLAFAAKVEKYPVLESLNITHLQGLPDSYPDPSLAFPNLRSLTLTRVSVNAILGCLVIPSSTLSGVIAWPKLKRIVICGDPLASIPLLHRIVSLRPRYSLSLCLDGHFKRNLDSWIWLEENADVCLYHNQPSGEV